MDAETSDLVLTDAIRQQLLDHAAQCAPRECCGLLVEVAGQLQYFASENLFPGEAGQDRFRLDPAVYAAAEDAGQVLAVVHSHPGASANPSTADRAGCERSSLPWLVVGYPSGVIKQVHPCGWKAPYKGRTFAHGVMDCYTLIQDWFSRELSVELLDFEREDDWWKRGEDLYMQGFEKAAFVRVAGAPQRHDVVLMAVASRHGKANHGAVYLGDGVILHHLWGRLSCEDVYGGYWLQHTVAVVRHQRQWLAVPA